MHVTVSPLEPYPNDPAASMDDLLPDLEPVFASAIPAARIERLWTPAGATGSKHRERRAQRLAALKAGEVVGRALARAAGVHPPPIRWRLVEPPSFENHIATLELAGRSARMRLESAVPRDGRSRLETRFERGLA
jgi:hypothetical protein